VIVTMLLSLDSPAPGFYPRLTVKMVGMQLAVEVAKPAARFE